MLTDESKEAVAKFLPDGDQAIVLTVFRWPVAISVAGRNENDGDRSSSSPAVLREYDHIRTVLSAEQDAIRC